MGTGAWARSGALTASLARKSREPTRGGGAARGGRPRRGERAWAAAAERQSSSGGSTSESSSSLSSFRFCSSSDFSSSSSSFETFWCLSGEGEGSSRRPGSSGCCRFLTQGEQLEAARRRGGRSPRRSRRGLFFFAFDLGGDGARGRPRGREALAAAVVFFYSSGFDCCVCVCAW